LPVRNSPCAGTFGSNCTVLSNDGMLVIARRSSNVANAKDTLAPSATGFLRWNRQSDPRIFGQARKHLLEEMAIEKEDIVDIECIGITRELERGGHTEAHFLAKVSQNFEELNKIRSVAYHRKEISSYIAVERKDFADYISNRKSCPALIGNLFLLTKAGRFRVSYWHLFR
jgi:hypothetical protein